MTNKVDEEEFPEKVSQPSNPLRKKGSYIFIDNNLGVRILKVETPGLMGYITIYKKRKRSTVIAARKRFYPKLVKYQRQNVRILEQKAIACLYYKEQIQESFLVSAILLAAMVIYFTLKMTTPSSIQSVAVCLPVLILFGLAIIKVLIIAFRIRKGYFGTNRDEAAALIRFIIDNSDDVDLSGGDRFKIFPNIFLNDTANDIVVPDGNEGFA
jgi:hypothetical protein